MYIIIFPALQKLQKKSENRKGIGRQGIQHALSTGKLEGGTNLASLVFRFVQNLKTCELFSLHLVHSQRAMWTRFFGGRTPKQIAGIKETLLGREMGRVRVVREKDVS
jgi:hypothetical protein